GDYQCPSCAMGEFTVKDLLEKFKNKLNHVFHHVQVTPEHRWSPTLARAAEAAGMQGKFWEYHRELFNNQAMFKEVDEDRVMRAITELAKKVKLDVLKFRSDKNKPEAAKNVGQMEA